MIILWFLHEAYNGRATQSRYDMTMSMLLHYVAITPLDTYDSFILFSGGHVDDFMHDVPSLHNKHSPVACSCCDSWLMSTPLLDCLSFAKSGSRGYNMPLWWIQSETGCSGGNPPWSLRCASDVGHHWLEHNRDIRYNLLQAHAMELGLIISFDGFSYFLKDGSTGCVDAMVWRYAVKSVKLHQPT